MLKELGCMKQERAETSHGIGLLGQMATFEEISWERER